MTIALKHRWKWSPACNGSAKCLRCGVKRKPLRKGGIPTSKTLYSDGGAWTQNTFVCIEDKVSV